MFILVILLLFVRSLSLDSKNDSNTVSEDSMDFETMRKRLKWSECYLLQEEHPWKGLKVQKRKHPSVYSNLSSELLGDLDHQFKLCGCYQPLNDLIKSRSYNETVVVYQFTQVMVLEKFEISYKGWNIHNISSLMIEMSVTFDEEFYVVPLPEREIKTSNEVLKWRMNNRPYFIKIKIRFLNPKMSSLVVSDLNVTFYGCSLPCGGAKRSVTDIVHYVQLQKNIPTSCLWYIEPNKSSSIVFNAVDVDMDCHSSDLIVADGSKPFLENKYSWLASFCRNSVSTVENLLYPKIWLYYTSGSSSKSPVEHFRVVYYGGCDRQYILTGTQGDINVSIHGASDVQNMKFDCSVFLRRNDKRPFIISFKSFYLFSLRKSACTSNYVMIYSGNSEINNIPFCDSIYPPKYIDARYGWMRLKIVNSAPIYDIDMVIHYEILTSNLTLPVDSLTTPDIQNSHEDKVSVIVFATFICMTVVVASCVIFYKNIETFFLKIRLFCAKLRMKKRTKATHVYEAAKMLQNKS